MSDSSYYPLAVGNLWSYKTKDGKTFTSKVTGAEGGTFSMASTAAANLTHFKKDDEDYMTDGIEAGKWLVILKENLKKGDTWQIEFTANGFNSILVYTVKEVGISKEVEGTTYNDVAYIEADSKLDMNGKIVSLNFLTKYYYAKGIGLILTTSSRGDWMGLSAYELH